MESTQREGIEKVFIDGGFAMNTHQHKGNSANMTRLSKWASLAVIATGAAVTLFSAAASAADRHENEGDRATQAGNGPGPAANGPGPGCKRRGGGGPPWRELLQETAERRRRRTPRHASSRRDASLRVRHRRLQPGPVGHPRP